MVLLWLWAGWPAPADRDCVRCCGVSPSSEVLQPSQGRLYKCLVALTIKKLKKVILKSSISCKFYPQENGRRNCVRKAGCGRNPE